MPQGAGSSVIELSPVSVEGQPRPNADIGPPPAPFAGGQVGTGARMGLFGNQSIFDTPFNQISITRQTIEDRQSRTLSDFISLNPTVFDPKQGASFQETIYIRGFRLVPNEIAFDGLYGLVQPRRPPVDPVERVEIQNGPGAFLYGLPPLGGVAGTINLVPKLAAKGTDEVEAFYRSAGNGGGRIDFGRLFGPNESFGARFNGTFRDGPTAVQDQSDRQQDGTLALDYRGERVRISAFASAIDFRRDGDQLGLQLAPGVSVPKAPAADRLYAQPWQYTSLRGGFGMIKAEVDLTDWATAGVAYGHSRYDEDYLSTMQTILSDNGNSRNTTYRQTNWYNTDAYQGWVRAKFATGPVRHEVALTAQSMRQTIGGALGSTQPVFLSNIYDPVRIPNPGYTRPANGPKSSVTQPTSFAVGDRLSILDERVSLIAGLRWSQFEVTNYVSPFSATASHLQNRAFTPSVAFVVKPIQPLSLYFNYIQALESGGTAPVTAANFGVVLPAQVSDQIEMGAKYDGGNIAGTLALFRISRPNAYVDTTTRVFAANGLQVNKGVELTIFGEPVAGLRIIGGVTGVDPKVEKSNGGLLNGKDAPAVPNYYGSVTGEYDLPWVPGMSLSSTVIYAGSAFYDAANTQRVPGWFRVDLGGRYTVKVRDQPVVVRAAIQNLAGRDYFTSADAGQLQIGSPRTFLLSTSLRF